MFTISFFVLCALCVLLFLYTRTKLSPIDNGDFRNFQRTYLCVYLLAVAGDWLQGPHVYALYASYGMTKHDIELLFIAGFGSSFLFGTFIGSIADKLGRRKNCLIYGVLYGSACITKHFANFWILMLGRLFGGIATSILYSAFESWLVFEHNKRGFTEDLLSVMFAHSVLGNSLVAIIAGVVAQFAADAFGYVAPFDVSLCILIGMSILIIFTWPENYGDAKADYGESFREAWRAIRKDNKILCLGLVQSLFEGSMYTFVLEWTPALTPDPATTPGGTTAAEEATIPHGLIFASFMVAVMIGSSLFQIASKFTRPESFMRLVFLVSAASLAVPIVLPGQRLLIFVGFVLFEVCVGVFWPAMGVMRGIYVPEAARSTIMNFFRIPLNLIVIGILMQNLPMKIIFAFCVGFLCLAVVFQQWLFNMSRCSATTTKSQGTTSAKETSDRLLSVQHYEVGCLENVKLEKSKSAGCLWDDLKNVKNAQNINFKSLSLDVVKIPLGDEIRNNLLTSGNSTDEELDTVKTNLPVLHKM